MSVVPESLQKIKNLITAIGEVTGEIYTDLTAAVQALKNGYGQSSSEPGKPYIDTSQITNFYYFCCNNRLNDYIDQIDTSRGTNFNGMFNNSSTLRTIPLLDTSRGTMFSGTFKDCSALRTIPLLDISRGTNLTAMCENCTSLETVALTTAKSNLGSTTFANCTALTNLTIGEGWAVNIYLTYSTALTQESLHGMIENLADLTGLTAKTFQVGATNLAKIDEEHIAMLNAKNWAYS